MQNGYSSSAASIRRREQLQHIEPRFLAFCPAQMRQKSALQCDDYILHLLASDGVAFLVATSETGSAGIPLREDIFVTTDQRPLEVLGGGLIGVAAIMPFLFDGAKELASIMVGGDD